MKIEEVTGLFTLAGFEVGKTWELANPYWPPDHMYDEVRTPWWLVTTDIGLIEIGWRKRVISIDWSATAVRKVVTDDDVTKSDTGVHAWSIEDALKYMHSLRYATLPAPVKP